MTALAGLAPALADLRRRAAFGWKARAETWVLVAHLVRPAEGVPPLELTLALERAAEVQALQGSPSRAHVLRDLAAAAGQGRLAARLAHWTRGPEAVLFGALGRTAEIDRLFDGAAVIARAEGRIARAIRAALIGPTLMGTALFVLLVMLARNLFPELEALVPITAWNPGSRALYGFAAFLSDGWAWLIPAALVVAITVRIAGARWTGPGRVTADRVPPFRFRALGTGAAFLLTITELARMREEMNVAQFRRLASNATTPYERDRIEAIAAELVRAGNPGRAAIRAGKRWPSDAMCAVLDAFAGQGDWANPFRAFLADWIDGVGERVEGAAKLMTFLLMALVAAIAATVVLSVFDIVSKAGGPI